MSTLALLLRAAAYPFGFGVLAAGYVVVASDPWWRDLLTGIALLVLIWRMGGRWHRVGVQGLDAMTRPTTHPLAHLAMAVLTVVCLLGVAALIGAAIVDGVS